MESTAAEQPIPRGSVPTSVRRLIDMVAAALPEGRAIAEEVWQRRHRGLVVLLWLHVGGVFVYSMVQGYGIQHSLFESGIVAIWAAGAQWGPDNRRFRSVSATLGLVCSSAVLVHISGGLIEFHFHYFFTLAAVSLYHDWAPFLTAIGFVAIQHGVMGALSPSGVYNHPDAVRHPWKWAGIHALFVLATSAVSLVRWKSSEVEALKDPLTWLPNRALFNDRLRQALFRAEGTGHDVAVLFLDVDDFKSINDTAGHSAGDRLLIVVADRLREAVRPADTVARLGGDEFAIVLEGISEVGLATEIADRILEALRAPLVFEGRRLLVTASIGIALRSDGAEGEADLVRNADIAMYVAKKSGKGRHAVFEPSMHRAVMERTELAKDLDGAAERGELRLVYQSINELEANRIAGFEALVRWDHPRLGTMLPGRFIPLAEETDLVVAVGRWVLRTACVQAKEWEAAYPTETPRWMSVNVSAQQLVDPQFVEHVLVALEESGLEPDRLVLEITETAMMGDNTELLLRLHRLKSIGVRIALDDFGTGYSSLGYLRRLPIDILKIDKTFVDGTDRGAEDSALARAILKIAEGMDLLCVAEGVERQTQVRELRAAGCDLAQGYLFCKPMDPEHVDALLTWGPAPASQPRGLIVVVVGEADPEAHHLDGLRDAGFDIIVARSSGEALLFLRKYHVDLIVLDLPLRQLDATMLADRISVDPALSSIPVLTLRGLPDETDEQFHVLERASNSHVQKPVGSDELVTNARRLVSVADAPA